MDDEQSHLRARRSALSGKVTEKKYQIAVLFEGKSSIRLCAYEIINAYSKYHNIFDEEEWEQEHNE